MIDDLFKRGCTKMKESCTSELEPSSKNVAQSTVGRPKFLGISLPHFFVHSLITQTQWHPVLVIWKSFSVAAECRASEYLGEVGVEGGLG